MAKKRNILMAAACMAAIAATAQQKEVTSTWNARKVVLPAAQYTTEWGSQMQALLVRRHFQLTADQLEGIAESILQLTVSYDENPRVYLNGTQIWSATGWNDNDYAVYTLSAADKRLLREGDNVVSVSLQQGEGGGHIDYGLVITEPYDPAATAIRDVEPAPAAFDLRTYDLQGRRVLTTSAKAPALLIRGGKKFIVRP